MKQSTTKWVLGHKITTIDTTGDYDLMMAETPPHVPGPPPHLHNTYTEAFLILEGELEFMVDGETRIVRAGESVDVPPNTLHTFNNKTDDTCRWINIHSPKGFRDFFDILGIPADEDNAAHRSVSEELIQKVIQTAADYDMHIPAPV